ncbi:Hypothetical predicted protein [Paramuricea clavata]|uniref:DUF5641 domain-containing protein n=1 Tax=Paramuricea clavata TaxID=317549 RepID=A0A7D9E262_PARCT|nr:Hypothetical predicted protein [Paramuricea clavata]
MLRFLWFDDITEPVPKIRRFQFCRLVFGLTPSPAVLASIIQHHLSRHKEREPEMVSLLNDSFYVDDFAGGAKTDDDAVEVYEKAQAIMKDGGFTLRKWMSNSKKFREMVEKNEEHQSYVNADKPTLNQGKQDVTQTSSNEIVKVLGLHWNVQSDVFQFETTELVRYALTLPPTKRSVLKLSAKIFDPIGILAPFTINMKCLFQTLCVENVDWGTELSGKSLSTWNSLLRDLLAIKSIRMPRCYFTKSSPISTHQIHGFSDASEKAYSAVVYLRTEYQDGTVEVNLISSKTRVAPLKRQSIPRLELLGANILARLVNTILKTLSAIIDDPEVFLWTDSYTTLCWIRNYKMWKQYVQRRVTEIRELTNEKHWHFCPGELNVADLPSRGCSATALAENDTWLHGPKFLKDPKDQWPKCPQPTNLETDVALSETVKTRPTVTYSLVNLTDDLLSHARIGLVMECNKYSSVTRLLRVTAFVLRFIRKLKGQETSDNSIQTLSANDIKEAEILWAREVQAVSFPEKSMGKTFLSFEEMRTMLVEIESTLNNRPLTYVYDDNEGVSLPLTPSCLIYGRRIATTPNDSQFEISSTNQSLTRRAKHQNRVLKNFTTQWKKDYLLSLRKSSKAQSRAAEIISVGDIVVLKNESTARIFWKLAKVEELITSKDNIVRSAKVGVLNEANKKIQLRRPIQHLVPLEISRKNMT